MKDKTNGSDLTAAQQKLTAAQAQKSAAIKNQNSAQIQQSNAQSLFDNTEQYIKEANQITTANETGKLIIQTVFEQIINPAWTSALEALNAANNELSAANSELSTAEEEVSMAENDLSEAEEAEEETKETEENTEQTALLSFKTAQTAENIEYTKASSSLNEDTEGNLGQNPDLAIVQENSDGTLTYLGTEGLKQNQDGSWTDKNGNRVEIESTYQNAGFETDGIVTLTLYEGDKTTKKSYNTAYNMYSEEIYDENNNCIQRSSASYNDKGEIINETKQTPIDNDNWMVESTNGNYIYNEKYDLCYATDENNNKCDGYYYSTVDLAIQAGNILKNGGTPLTESEIQDYVTNLHNAKNKDTLTEILKNENLTSDNLVSIITAYNNKYAGVESSDNKSRIAYNNKYGLTESFFNDKPQNSFINHLDKVLSGKNKENVMKLITEKIISSSENGNSYATDMLAREIYNSTAGKTGTSDEFVMNIVNDDTNPKVLSDVMERYSVVNNGRNIIKDIENDFNPLLDSSVFDTLALKETLNNAFKVNHDGMSYEEYLKSAQSAKNKLSYIGTSDEKSQTQDTNTDTNKPQDLTQDPNVEFWPKAYKVGDKTCYKVAGVDGLMLNGFSIADHDIYGNKIYTENAIEYYMGQSNSCTIWIQDETTGKTTKVTYDKSTRTRTEEIYDSEKYYKQSFVQYDETGKVIDWSNESTQPTQSNQSAKTNSASATVNTASTSQSSVNSTENTQENKDNLTASLINVNTPFVNKASAAGPWSSVPGAVVDATDGDTKDGEIGETKQGQTGDCWLLSAVNALSYTEEGKNLIKDSLEYTKDGTYVNLKGLNEPIYIPNSEVTKTKGSLQYSSGDDDMIILELAIEKVMDKYANEELLIEDNEYFSISPSNTEVKETRMFASSIGDGGFDCFVMYLLSGKIPEETRNGSESSEEIENILNEFQTNNNQNIALGFGIASFEGKENIEGLGETIGTTILGEDYASITDVNGKKHKIGANHAYAIKKVSDNTVTVVNPWDSGDEIVLSREQFMGLCDRISKIDLSENNPSKNCIIRTQKETIENSDGSKTEYVKDENGTVLKEYQYDKKGKLKKEIKNNTNDGQLDYEIYYHDNGKESLWHSADYYDNGRIKSQSWNSYDTRGNKTESSGYFYNENGSHESEYKEIYENGKIKEAERTYYDENGNFKYKVHTKYDKDGKELYTEKDTDGDGIYDSVEFK